MQDSVRTRIEGEKGDPSWRKAAWPQIVARILDHVRANDLKSVRNGANRGHFLAVDGTSIPVPEEEEAVGEDALYYQIAENRLSDRLNENELMTVRRTTQPPAARAAPHR